MSSDSNRNVNTDADSALAVAHRAINTRHNAQRSRLLNSLPAEGSRSARRLLLTRLKDTRPPWQLTCGVGLAAVLIAAFFVLGSDRSASAAEALNRMTQAIDKVSSFSWRYESQYHSRRGDGRTLHELNLGQWRREPASLFASWRITETPATETKYFEPEKTLVEIEETYQAGRRGILINHLKEEFHWIDGPFDGTKFPSNSPQVLIYKVRTRCGQVLRDLGNREINGVAARGITIRLDDGEPVSDAGPAVPDTLEEKANGWTWRNIPVDVWIHPTTDLPIEFSFVRRGADFETRYRVSDLRWNLSFDPEHFAANAVDGYAMKVLAGPPSE